MFLVVERYLPHPSDPDAARFHLHTTKAYIPIDVVKALAVSPSLIQKAAEAFYTRDAVQLRVGLSYVYHANLLTWFLVSSSDGSLPSELLCASLDKIDTNCVCSTCWAKVFSPKDIWEFARRR